MMIIEMGYVLDPSPKRVQGWRVNVGLDVYVLMTDPELANATSMRWQAKLLTVGPSEEYLSGWLRN